MPAIQEPPRNTPVAAEVDLCVIGGSCTGVFAAVRAARLGARVAIVELNGFFGGVASAGLVPIWHPFDDALGKDRIVAGLSQEIVDRLAERNAVTFSNPPSVHAAFVLNTEELKIELDRLISDAGVRPFLHARFVAPVGADGRLDAIVIEDKSGRRAIAARYFIDATGDGDLVARMGLPTRTLPGLQPPTSVVIFENYARIKQRNPKFDLGAAVHDPRHPGALKEGFLWGAQLPGRPDAYMVAGTRAHHADCSDADQLTSAEIECRRQARRMHDILRNHIDGGSGVVLSQIASYIGIRETRHAECLHTLTENELLGGERFPDAIANGTYCVDVHHSDRPGITLRYLDGRQRYCVPGSPAVVTRWRDEAEGVTPFYQIPYRSLVPQGSKNVLVAGRLIGADRGAYGAIRVMVNCNQTGEAAGIACFLAMRENATVDRVNADALRATLRAGGSIIV